MRVVLSRIALVALLTLLATGPARAQIAASPVGHLAPTTHVEWRRDKQLVDDAVLSMLSLWVINIWAAGIGDLVCNGSCTDHAYDLLYLPIAGPAIAAATPGVQRAGQAWAVILVADSVLQVGAGLTALVAALLRTERVVVPSTHALRLAPSAPGAALGLTLTIEGLSF